MSNAGRMRPVARRYRLGLVSVPDPDIARPPRPCNRCKAPFQPTMRRRLLCPKCFYGADTDTDREYRLLA